MDPNILHARCTESLKRDDIRDDIETFCLLMADKRNC